MHPSQQNPKSQNRLNRMLERLTKVREAIIRHHPQESRSINIAIYLYIGGLIPFFAFADWSKPLWAQSYYIWQTSKDMFLLGCIYLIAAQKHKAKILPILAFATVRAIWEVVCFISKADVNNIMIVDYFFLLTVAIVLYQVVRKSLVLLRSYF